MRQSPIRSTKGTGQGRSRQTGMSPIVMAFSFYGRTSVHAVTFAVVIACSGKDRASNQCRREHENPTSLHDNEGLTGRGVCATPMFCDPRPRLLRSRHLSDRDQPMTARIGATPMPIKISGEGSFPWLWEGHRLPCPANVRPRALFLASAA